MPRTRAPRAPALLAVAVAAAWLALPEARAADPAQAETVPERREVGDPAAGHDAALRWCDSCHLVPGGEGTDAAPTFVAIANRPDATEDRLRGFLLKAHGEMPDFQLPLPHINNIVAYLLSLRARTAPPPTPPGSR